MKELFTNKKFYKTLFMILILIYAACNFIGQQKTINSYNREIVAYQEKIQEQNEYKEKLLATQSDATSLEYIEEIAREKLDMYMPNEKVYVDKSK